MPHLKRFYCDSAAIGEMIILDQAQSNHLKNVLRLKVHSMVEVFNSHNESFLAEVFAIPSKGEVELKIISMVTPKHSALPTPHFPLPDITLACAVAKGSRMDWLVEKAAEIGLTRLIPIITERTVVKPDKYSKNLPDYPPDRCRAGAVQAGKIARWHKLAVSAAKQTGQNSILAIDNPVSFSQLENIISDFSLSLIAVPNADKYLPEVLEKGNLTSKDKILYLIGPEGDFTKEETAIATRWGVQPVRLPVNSILRVETAAITMLAMILYQRAEMKDKR